MPATKVATCCYCGSKTALKLRGKDRHELACANCAAPLRNLKAFPVTPAHAAAPAERPARTAPKPRPAVKQHKRSRRPTKRRNIGRIVRRIWEDVWDELEDIFD